MSWSQVFWTIYSIILLGVAVYVLQNTIFPALRLPRRLRRGGNLEHEEPNIWADDEEPYEEESLKDGPHSPSQYEDYVEGGVDYTDLDATPVVVEENPEKASFVEATHDGLEVGDKVLYRGSEPNYRNKVCYIDGIAWLHHWEAFVFNIHTDESDGLDPIVCTTVDLLKVERG